MSVVRVRSGRRHGRRSRAGTIVVEQGETLIRQPPLEVTAHVEPMTRLRNKVTKRCHAA